MNSSSVWGPAVRSPWWQRQGEQRAWPCQLPSWRRARQDQRASPSCQQPEFRSSFPIRFTYMQDQGSRIKNFEEVCMGVLPTCRIKGRVSADQGTWCGTHLERLSHDALLQSVCLGLGCLGLGLDKCLLLLRLGCSRLGVGDNLQRDCRVLAGAYTCAHIGTTGIIEVC